MTEKEAHELKDFIWKTQDDSSLHFRKMLIAEINRMVDTEAVFTDGPFIQRAKKAFELQFLVSEHIQFDGKFFSDDNINSAWLGFLLGQKWMEKESGKINEPL